MAERTVPVSAGAVRAEPAPRKNSGPPPEGRRLPLRGGTVDPAVISRSLAKSMTGIEWADFTVNHWTVCTPLKGSQGAPCACDICYAAGFATTRLGLEWGAGVPRHRFKGACARARQIDRVAARGLGRFSVFSLSLGDWLDPEADPAWRAELVETIEACGNIDWLLLTHRPHLLAKLAPASWRDRLPGHVWPGVTVEHRNHAFRWQQLLDQWGDSGRCWTSVEPMASDMEGVDFDAACSVIIGGASNTADPAWRLRPDWVEPMLERYAETAFFKQWGVFDAQGRHVGDKKKAGREFGGKVYDRTPWIRNREALAARRAGVNDNAERNVA